MLFNPLKRTYKCILKSDLRCSFDRATFLHPPSAPHFHKKVIVTLPLLIRTLFSFVRVTVWGLFFLERYRCPPSRQRHNFQTWSSLETLAGDGVLIILTGVISIGAAEWLSILQEGPRDWIAIFIHNRIQWPQSKSIEQSVDDSLSHVFFFWLQKMYLTLTLRP